MRIGNGTQWSVPVLANTPFSDSTGSLKDGVYQLVVHGAAVVSNGTPMVLDFTAPTFHRLLRDLNGDGNVGFNDLLGLAQNYGSTTATAAQGDLNGDGRVGFPDLLILAQNYGRTTSPATAATPFDASADPLRPQTACRGRLNPRGRLIAVLSEPTR